MLESIIHLVQHFGLGGIASSMIIENIGIPLPTEAAFLVSQTLITQGNHSFWFMYWFVVGAHMIGAIVAYFIGFRLRLLGDHFLARSQKFIQTRAKLEQWYKQYGIVIVLAARLIGYVRPWASLVAGFAEFSFWPFLLWTFIGTLLIVYPSMKATALLVLIWNRYPGSHIFISVIMLFSFFGVLLFVHRRQKNSGETGEVVNDNV